MSVFWEAFWCAVIAELTATAVVLWRQAIRSIL